ncbi:ferredoxin--NADP reductase [Mucilaginibacter galii]|uniref:Phenylacetic acid degradation protein n=1 Tax=Mucilaginibacter galii TaxID=2005073 RepID=A0A917N0X7_9SPHI|nr:ferredoxin--NADP reductase [Mucilaginibacter galii]GGI49909.1 phenylacetic acid degradation protein [Mucilaginibacter galii]
MLQLRVEAIEKENADTSTFYLKEVNGNKIAYQAGQFITLVINHHGEEIRRSYSLSSSPQEALLAVTIKRIPNGEITRYLHAYTKIGDVWNAVEPAGRFTPPQLSNDTTLFYFAAGSGIVPIYAHLKYLLRQQSSLKITLFYSNLNSQAIIFKQQLDELANAYPQQLNIVHLLSSEARRLNNIMAEKLVREYARAYLQQAQFYICGPFTYMRMVQLTLLYMGMESSQIHKENFVLETVPVSTTVTNFAPQKLRIFYQQEWHDIVVGENQTILQAALQNQLHIPYSCGSGVCAACAVKCTNGNVTIVKNEVLTDAELKQGWVLTCTGYAVSDDVVLDFG